MAEQAVDSVNAPENDQTKTALQELAAGWTVILACCIGLACGLGAIPIYSIGALTKPLTLEFGWSRTQVQLIYTATTIGILVAAPVLGIIVDRFGARRITLTCVLGTSIGLAATGFLATSLWSFYLLSFITALIGIGTVPITWTRVIIGRFIKARGVALGFALAGTGISASFLPGYVTWLITDYGWRYAYFGLAALPLLLALPIAYVFLHEPSQASPVNIESAPVPDATSHGISQSFISNYRFWILSVAFTLIGISTAGMIGHFVPLLTDEGFSVARASQLMGVVGISIIAGRLVTGVLIDRFWAPGVAFLVLLLPALACILLVGQVGYQTAVISAILLGLAAGAEFDLMSYLVSQYFGKNQYGRIYSVLYVVFMIGAGVGGPVFGLAFDFLDSYETALIFSAVSFALSGALLLFLKGSTIEEV